MAETKTTKKSQPKAKKEPVGVEEDKVVVQNEVECIAYEAEKEVEASEPAEVVETYVEANDTVTATVTDEPQTTATQADVSEYETPTAEEPITAENVAEKIAEEVSAINSATEKELSDFYEHLDDAVKEAQNAEPEKVAEVASKKLNELEEIEKRLEDELDKEVEALSATQRKAADKLFGRGFGEFWNGVSTGWEN